MTDLELVKETVQYYLDDPSRRAELNGQCYYRKHSGEECAVGRLLDHKKVIDAGLTIDQLNKLGQIDKFPCSALDLLKDEYNGVSIQVLRDLQEWHDNGFPYDNKEYAKGASEILIEKYEAA